MVTSKTAYELDESGHNIFVRNRKGGELEVHRNFHSARTFDHTVSLGCSRYIFVVEPNSKIILPTVDYL